MHFIPRRTFFAVLRIICACKQHEVSRDKLCIFEEDNFSAHPRFTCLLYKMCFFRKIENCLNFFDNFHK